MFRVYDILGHNFSFFLMDVISPGLSIGDCFFQFFFVSSLFCRLSTVSSQLTCLFNCLWFFWASGLKLCPVHLYADTFCRCCCSFESVLLTAWICSCCFLGKITEIVHRCLLFRAEIELLAQGHPAGSIPKVQVEFMISWFQPDALTTTQN